MADEELKWFEAALGAISKDTSDREELVGARCPKCNASSFVKASDLYSESVGRLEIGAEPAGVAREGGLSDAQIVEKLSPPRPRSAIGVVIAVAVPLSAVAFYVYRRFGDTVGQITVAAAVVVTAIVLMTTIRRFSDQYYHRRQRWNKLFMCRRCGQLVAS